MTRNKLLLFFLRLALPCCLLFPAAESYGQSPDSVPQKDTLHLYRKIKKASYKRRITKFLYHAIFVDAAPEKYEKKPLSDQQKKEDPNQRFSEKNIRRITVTVYDPFGYSVNDTTLRETNPFQKLGNKYHITTRQRVIRNLLLFRPDEKIDLLKISESERLLRQSGYINDARIYLTEAADSSGRVDIRVVVHDKWTVDALVAANLAGGHVVLRDRNLAGLGQTYEQYLGYHIPSGQSDFRGRYRVANIRSSYVSSELFYATTRDLTQTGFIFDRPFYSPLAKWAGGISGTKTWGTYLYDDTTATPEQKTALDRYDHDNWIAKSFSPTTGVTSNRRLSNIVLALRYAATHYQQRPSFSIDTARINTNSALVLGSVGFSLSKFYKDQYIFRFGANEDVPEGLVVQLLYGVQQREYYGTRYYAGIELSRGKHYKGVGYLSGNIAYGTFYRHGAAGTAAVNGGITFFTDLLGGKEWHYRQFIYLKYIQGINQPFYQRITFRPEELYGFNSGTATGTGKALLNLESVLYAPYNFFGFRFAPIVMAGFGLLNPNEGSWSRSPFYQAYAVGLLIRNENLLTSSFEVTFGAYPILAPGTTQAIRFNPVTSFTLKVRTFSIAKPVTVAYE